MDDTGVWVDEVMFPVTIFDKPGVITYRHLIHEAPWYNDSEYKGFIEISIDITYLDITK